MDQHRLGLALFRCLSIQDSRLLQLDLLLHAFALALHCEPLDPVLLLLLLLLEQDLIQVSLLLFGDAIALVARVDIVAPTAVLAKSGWGVL